MSSVQIRKCETCGIRTDDWFVSDNNASGVEQVYCAECDDTRAEKYGAMRLTAEAEYYGECDGCGGQYELTGDQHCTECGGHSWCCEHE